MTKEEKQQARKVLNKNQKEFMKIDKQKSLIEKGKSHLSSFGKIAERNSKISKERGLK